jgi:hypothetical protein
MPPPKKRYFRLAQKKTANLFAVNKKRLPQEKNLGSQPLTVVCRNARPYRELIPSLAFHR